MKYIKLWLSKQLSRSYERSRLKGLDKDKAEKVVESFIDENRRRIQDLELVTKELAQKLEKLNQESGRL